MISRISTAGVYAQGLASLLDQQAQLARAQQQLGTGLRLNTAADDPVSAGTAVALDRSFAELQRFGENAKVLQHRLSQQENVLRDFGDQMVRVRELAVQANSTTLSPADRKAIAIELQQVRETMIGLANSSDGNGRFLFGGTQDSQPPFVATGTGVNYVGDQSQRLVDVAPGLAVADAMPGSELFMRTRTGDGRIAATVAAGNTGTGVLGSSGMTDSSLWDGGQYQVNFISAGNYEVRDAGGVLVSSGSYVSGQAIGFRGVQITLTGAPAAGDSYSVQPSPARDIFATVQGLIDTLQKPITTATERAAQQNAMFNAIQDVTTAQDHVLDLRASGGAQLTSIDGAQSTRDAQAETIETTLSSLRDLDYAEAATRMSQHLTALEAAQSSFLRIQSLSLFDKLR